MNIFGGVSSSAWATASARPGSPGSSTRSASSAAGRRWFGADFVLERQGRRTIVSAAEVTSERADGQARRTTSATPSRRTVEATLGSAERSRSAAQGALDDLVESVEDLRKGAEERLSRGRRSVTDAIEGRRPATSDDIKELKAELRAIGRRLDTIEERLPRQAAKRAPTKSSRARSSKRAS